MIRIFTAFPIRNELADSLLQLSENNSQIKNIRWTPKENLHITLFFIGEIKEEHLEKIKSKLEYVFENQKTFHLEFESIIFKGRKHPSMLWAGFKMSKAFSELSEKIYQTVKEFMTIVPVHKDPIPHCTLARIKPSAELSAINTSIQIHQSIFKIDKAELWKTVQMSEGVKYESLQGFSMHD